MSKKQSLERLRKAIDAFTNVEGGMLYRNSFALACYLVTKGEIKAAKKLLKCLFDVLGWEKHKTYFFSITDSMEGFAEEYAVEIEANSEINELFEAKA